MEYMNAHPEGLKQIDKQRHQQAIQRAARWRLGQSARGTERTWAARQGCKLLCQLGHALVRLGQGREHSDAPQTV